MGEGVRASHSTALATGSARISIPGSPPKGLSSTFAWRSWQKSRGFAVRNSTRPAAAARPRMLWSSAGRTISGKRVTKSTRSTG